MKSKQLLPCPFCGGAAKVQTHEFFKGTKCYGVVCKTCDTSGYQFFGKADHAIRAWNTRVKTMEYKGGTEHE